MNEQLLIIGASYAGLQLAASARELGFEGRIDLLGDESYAPYQRPPLSKGYLSGAFTSERLPLKSNAFFEDQRIDLTRGARVTAIDRGSKTVELNDGSRRGYDFLGIATGARPRMLNCPGAAHEAVLYLRNLDDASRLVARMQDTQSAVVVGGGYIGLEVAASLRQKGIDVTVIEAQKNLLARVASASLASFVEGLHSEKGVSIQLGRTISEIRDDHGRARVTLNDGTTLTADLVVVGIGVEPNTELAQGVDSRSRVEFWSTHSPVRVIRRLLQWVIVPHSFRTGICKKDVLVASNRYRTQTIWRRPPLHLSSGSPIPTIRCPGFGPTSTT